MNYAAAGEVRDIISHSTELGNLVHKLQEERDTTAFYLGSLGIKDETSEYKI